MKFSLTLPCDLEEGYRMQVQVQGQNLVATMPRNAKKGETIEFDDADQKINVGACPDKSPAEDIMAEKPRDVCQHQGLDAPRGAFRFGLCTCCDICCSPLWWMACCCLCIPFAQLLSRMGFNVWGLPAKNRRESSSREAATKTFAIVVCLWVLYRILLGLFIMAVAAVNCEIEYNYNSYSTSYYGYYSNYSTETTKCESLIQGATRIVVIIFFAILWIYVIVQLTNARYHFRQQYSIHPGDGCCGDCCSVFWCTCCSVVQMLRHTHDDTKHRYQPCNIDGLPPDTVRVV